MCARRPAGSKRGGRHADDARGPPLVGIAAGAWLVALALTIGVVAVAQPDAGAAPRAGPGAVTTRAAATAFGPGSLIIPMDTNTASNHAAFNQNQGMWKAYGLLYRLLQNGIPVHWAINESKTATTEVDFTAPSVRDLRTGTALGSWDYRGGPFIVDSADAAEALPIIRSWWTANNNQPNVHEALEDFSADTNVTLRSAPRIANDAVNAGISIAYYNAAGIPDLNGNPWSTRSPNVFTQQQIAEGGLFTQGPGCPQRRFDVFVTPHNSGYSYSLSDPTNLGTRAYAELDNFVEQGGGWTALCHSILSNENAMADLTLNGSNAVKALFRTSEPGGKPGGFLTTSGFPKISNTGGSWAIHPEAAGLPVAQLVPPTATPGLPGGSVQTWPAPGSAGAPTYWPQTERVGSFTTTAGVESDQIISGVYRDGTGQGKVTYIGGHSFSTSLPYSGNSNGPYLRAFYNSLFFNGAAVAKLDLTSTPTSYPQNGTGLITANIVNSGGSVAKNVGDVTVTLAPGFNYDGTTHGPEPEVSADGRTLTWPGGLGDVQGGATAVSFEVVVTPEVSGTTGDKRFAQLHATYGDVFGEGFTAAICREITIAPTPAPKLTKTASTQEPVATGSTVSWTLNYGNSGAAALVGATLEDRLPPGFTFVSSSSSPDVGPPAVIPAVGGTILRWSLGTIPADTASAGTVTVSARAGAVTEGTGEPPQQAFTNNATLKGQDAAGNPFSEAAASAVTVRALSLTLGKTVDKTFLDQLPGNVTYTLTPRSDTNDLLENVHVLDALPAGVSSPPVAVGQGGTYGGYTPSPAVDGHEEGPPVLDTAISVSSTSVNQGDTVTVTMNVRSSVAVSEVSSSNINAGGISGGPATCTGPNPASANVPAGGAGVNFTWSCTLEGQGEYFFSGNAADAEGTTNWPAAISASVLSSAGGGPNVVSWSLGSTTPAVGGSILTSGYTAGVYALRGGGQPTFQKFDLDTRSWEARANTPANVNKGGALTTDSEGTIYELTGDGKQTFNAYDIETGKWTSLANTGTNVGEGGALVYLASGETKYVYALMGNGAAFKRYDVAAGSWAPLANTPANVKKGGALTTDGTYIYALQGDGKKGFWRYDPGANSWTALPQVPDNVAWGGALTFVGGQIYATIGGGKNKFYRYDIGTQTWTLMANAPANIADGGALTTDGTSIYAFRGKATTFWRYDIATNTWSVLPAFTANTGQGAALVYAPARNPHGRFTTLSDSRSLTSDGETVDLTLTLSSTEAVEAVTPGSLVVTPTEGTSCSTLTGPVLVSEDDKIEGEGDAVVYRWTCTVAAGATPGSLTFSADASGAGSSGPVTFASATSNSTLVAPPLTFTVTVPPGAPNPVVNSGLLAASNQSVSSPEVATFHGPPELTIVKSNSPAEGTLLRPGDPISYQMTVENTGQSAATGVIVDDPVPDGTDYVSCSGGESCEESGGTVSWAIGTLAPGETVTVAFTVSAASSLPISAAPHPITNSATVSSDQTTPVTSNTVMNEVEVRPELVKTVSAAEAGPGDTLTYTLSVRNPGDAFTGDVTDAVPQGTTFKEGSCHPECVVSEGIVTWAEQVLPHGSSTFTFDVIVNAGTGGMTVHDVGTLDPSEPNLEPIESNEAETDIGPTLAIVKTNYPRGEVRSGDEITYTLAITNETNVTAHDVVVSDPLPLGTSFGTCTTPVGSCHLQDGVVTFELGEVSGGETVTVTFTVTVGTPPVGTLAITNQAQVNASNAEGPVLSTEVQNPLPFPALLLTKTATPQTVDSVGDEVTYHYLVRNNSTTTTLAGPITVDDDRATVTCPPGDLAPLAAVTCTAVYHVTQADLDAGSVTNTAIAHADGTESNEDKAVVEVVQTPHLTLEKRAELDTTKARPADRVDPGDLVHYTLTATNDGNVTLGGVAISDPSLPGLECEPEQPARLKPGAELVCHGTHVLTQADIDSGSVANHATVKGTDSNEEPVEDEAEEEVPLPPAPHLSLEKQATLDTTKAGPADRVDPGDLVHYTLTATNDGNVTLEGVAISDPSLPGLECEPEQPARLKPGDELVCTGIHVLTQADIDSGSVANTATVAGTDPIEEPVEDEAEEEVPLPPAPHLSLTKEAELDITKAGPPDRADPGDLIHYTLTATNDGNVTLHGVTISDPSLPGLKCEPEQPADLKPGDELVCTGTHVLTQADINAGGIANQATSSGTGPNEEPVEDEAEEEVPLSPAPHLTLEKQAAEASFDAAGQTLHYTYRVKNTGNISLAGPVAVSDDRAGNADCPALTTIGNEDGSFDPGEELICTATYQVTQADLNAGSLTNTAVASAGGVESNEDQAVVVAVRSPQLTLEKQAAESSFDAVGQVLHYTYTVKNTGNVSLAGPAEVKDDRAGEAECPALSTVGNHDDQLDPGEELVCTASYTVTQADLDAGSVTNTATARAGGTESNEDQATVDAAQEPHLSLEKQAELDTTKAGPADRADSGDLVHYTLRATNDGNVTLEGVRISDASLPGLECEPEQPAQLKPGAELVCHGTHVLTQADIDSGSVANHAIVKGTDPSEEPVEDEAEEEVPLPPAPHLSLEKQATLDMTAVGPNDRADPGDLVRYSLRAVNDGNVTLEGVTISDPSLPGLECGPEQPAELRPGDELVCHGTHVLTQADIDSGSVANTATVAGTDPNEEPVEDEAEEEVPLPPAPHLSLTKEAELDTTKAGPADRADPGDLIHYTLRATNDGNVTLGGVAISDPSLPDLECEPEQPADLRPGAELVCHGAHVLTQADIDSGSVANTATVAGTGPSEEPVEDEAEEEVPLPPAPHLTLQKEATLDMTVAGPPDRADPGDLVHYTLRAVNDGNVTLEGVAISDPSLPGLECEPEQPARLKPGAELACIGAHVLTQADIDSGSVANTATVAGTDPNEEPVEDEAEEEVPLPPAPHLSLTKEAELDTTKAGPPDRVDPGDLVLYTLTATNDGNVTLHGVAISDPSLPGLECEPEQPADLRPGDELVCHGAHVLTQDDIDSGSVANTATVAGTDPNEEPVEDEAEEEVPLPPAPHLTLQKEATLDMTAAGPNDRVDPGDLVHYTLTATNDGNVTLHGVRISDPSLPGLECEPEQPADLRPGDELVCTGTHVLTQADINAGVLENTATVEGTDPEGEKVDDSDSAAVVFGHVPHLTLAKEAEESSFDAVGQVLHYRFRVVNDGNVSLAGPVTVKDDRAGEASCPPPQTVGNEDGNLDPGEELVCAASYTVTQANLDAGSVTNTATAHVGGTESNEDQATVDAAQEPHLSLEKQAELDMTAAGPNDRADPGDLVRYTLTATNHGNVTLHGVRISDPSLPDLECEPEQPADLKPGAELVCHGTHVLTQADIDSGSVANHATVAGTGPGEEPVEDEAEEEVPLPPAPHLTLQKEATLDMTAAGPNDRVDPGDLVRYTLTATNDGNVTLEGVAISDPSLPGLECEPEQPADLKPGAELVCHGTHVLTQADIDSGSVANHATVAGTGPGEEPVEDEAEEEVPLPPAPHLTLQKEATLDMTAAGPNDRVDPGDLVRYTLTATNDGNVTLEGVAISDPSLPGLECEPEQPADLKPGADLVCHGAHVLTQADIDSGSVANTAAVKGTGPNEEPVEDEAEEEVPLPPTPHLTLRKEATLDMTVAGPPDRVDPGDLVHYTLTATNDGNVTLHGVTISDPSLPGLECEPEQPAGLRPGDELVCHGAHVLTQADINAGGIANQATSSGTGPNEEPVEDEAEEEVPLPPAPHLSLTKEAELDTTKAGPPDRADPGDLIHYTLRAVNDGNVTLHGVTISDPSLPGLECEPEQPADLKPGAELVCHGAHVLTQADIDSGSVANHATVSGTDPNEEPVEDEAEEEVPLPQVPGLALVKEADRSSFDAPGQVLHYTYRVRNTGNVSLAAPVTVADDKAADESCPSLSTVGNHDDRLDPGEEITCTASYTVTQDDLNGGSVTNTAIAHADGVESNEDQVVVEAAQAPHLTLTKEAEESSFAAVGDVLHYRFRVSNTGNVSLAGPVEVKDDGAGEAECPALSTVGNHDDRLDPGEEIICTASYTVTQADLDAGSVTNTATAHAGGTESNEDQATVDAAQAPHLSLTKEAHLDMTAAGPPDRVDPGDLIHYTLTATNDGNVTLEGVQISDPSLPGLECEPELPADLKPGAELVCHGTHVLNQADIDSGSVANQATVAGTDPSEEPVEDEAEVEVPLPPAPHLSLTKEAELDTTKAGPPDRVDPGDLVHYTLRAVNDGNETLHGVTISDPSLPGLECEPEQPADLKPGDELVCIGTHVLTQAEIDSGSVANTATVRGTGPGEEPVEDEAEEEVPLLPTPHLSLIKEAELDTTKAGPPDRADPGDLVHYTLTAINDGNVTLEGVAISDPSLPGLECEPPQPADLKPGAELVCHGAHVLTQADIDRGAVINHATVSGTGPGEEPVEDEAEEEVPLPLVPRLTLIKQATLDATQVPPDDRADAGDFIDYTLTATNDGNTSLRVVEISDVSLDLTCHVNEEAQTPPPGQPVTLEPGDTLTCAGRHTLTQTDIDRGSVANTATVTGTDPNNNLVTDEDSAEVDLAQVPQLTLTKHADETSFDSVGDVLHYTYKVKNTGNATLAGPVTVFDNRTEVTCPPGDLAPGQTITCTAKNTVTQADLDAGRIRNRARAHADGIDSNRDRARVPAAQDPRIRLTKTANATAATTIGDTVTFTLHVQNVGNVTITGYHLSDGLPGLSAIDCAGQPTRLEPGDTATCTATYTVTRGDVEAGAISNHATVDGETDTAGPVSDTDETTVPLTPLGTLQVVKRLAPPTDSGRFDLEINGVPEAKGVGDGGRTPAVPVLPGVDNAVSETAAEGTHADDYTSEITCARDGVPIVELHPAHIRVGLGENVVCTITNTAKPTEMKVTKTGPGLAREGETITYEIRVTNSGTVPLRDVTLREEIGATKSPCQGGPQLTGGDANANGVLDPTETWTYSCAYVVQRVDEDGTGHIVNVVRVTATAPSGRPVGPVEASATTLVARPALTLVKSGPSVARPGQVIRFDLAVTNRGNVPFAQSEIRVEDPTCASAPRLVDRGHDRSPASLDPGDTWTYRCSVRTAASQTVVRNTARVEATDRFGATAAAHGSFRTRLTTAPPRGHAKLRGRTGCAFGPFLATVRGRRIARVTFRLDGRVIKQTTNNRNARVIRVLVNPARLRPGPHRLVARVTFTAGTVPSHKTLKLFFRACRKPQAPPVTG